MRQPASGNYFIYWCMTVLVGCAGDGPELPEWLFETDATFGGEDSTAAPSRSFDVPFECGNDVVEAIEECDGTDMQGATCESLGQASGPLGCTESCMFDLSGCVPPGMVLVPAGELWMGSVLESDEEPIRRVTLDAFWIDAREVTVAEYVMCTVCRLPLIGEDCNWETSNRADHPVNCVSWDDAVDYCAWVDLGTKRLPTEAEWEKAARGADARSYPWGDSPEPSCDHVVMSDAAAGGDGCGTSSTLPVGSRPMGASIYGAQDMAGNVREWVADWYASVYSEDETDNPKGPLSGSYRAVRGASWINYIPDEFRTSSRISYHPTNRLGTLGFRCARSASLE